jgi:hypothetical protein
MRSPMSIRLAIEAPIATVTGRVLGHADLPAAPDAVRPGAGEEPRRVGVALAARTQLPVAGLRSLVASPRVTGEVAQGVSELGVAAPTEGHRPMAPRGTCGGRHARQPGPGRSVRNACSAVTDLGEGHPAEAGRAILRVCLLMSVGKHPVVQGRVCRSLTDRRSGALSPIAGRRRANGHQGCANSLLAVDAWMVDQ